MHLLLLLHATFRGIFDEELSKNSLSSTGLLRDFSKGKGTGRSQGDAARHGNLGAGAREQQGQREGKCDLSEQGGK